MRCYQLQFKRVTTGHHMAGSVITAAGRHHRQKAVTAARTLQAINYYRLHRLISFFSTDSCNYTNKEFKVQEISLNCHLKSLQRMMFHLPSEIFQWLRATAACLWSNCSLNFVLPGKRDQAKNITHIVETIMHIEFWEGKSLRRRSLWRPRRTEVNILKRSYENI
jgi:hypothetical protein